MSLTAAAIRLMAAKGMSAADIADVAEANETTPTLSKGAERTRRWRERKAEGVTGDVTVTRHGDVSHVGERAQVVTPSLPSLRSEEVKPISPDGDIAPLKAKCAKPNGFARFWEAYPNKVGKAAAEAAYAKALKRITGPDPPSVLLAGVERAKASRAWAEGFIPHPTTWLRQGRWDDQPAEVIPLQPRQAHERTGTDHRNNAFRDKLLDVGAAMDAAFEQPRRTN